ncbi:UDP-3-O-acyl-N-acetylglucosamine deacetylase [Vulcanimicrobium alpinum]|uniref:UDP-3-O-acyl-N-acetylglucosamine deacetylase n=1 Tax=Vulcanimicrobium alpinum TaxID=3016050 RepID=A0AAN1XSQ3_UNVUL|nr:UDP-3-O-acyl-N-acetylglucosamine deacetylase [Vulcanimicrobium alpinum]BDE04735.1 UDP-3-O-acyl-N-acetylglucosamine deacetylase [Vulcanimicrobium alpinum]
MQYQTTLRDAIAFEGAGLHTGVTARVRVLPAPAGHGLRFRLDDSVEFPARADYVLDTVRATVVGVGAHRVSTVEHLLSALLGCGVDNALIDVHGGEIPVEDGSAKAFADAIDAVGIATLHEARVRWIPAETRVFRDGDKMLIVAPASSFRVRMMVDYPPPIGAQYVDVEITPEAYRAEVAPNRTFGYQHEVEGLLKRGLAQGGTLENAVVFGPDGPLAPLRSESEPARHKILDLVGDFALLGAYPQCEVIAIKSGHKLHCTAVRELRHDLGESAAVTATS